jgi:hypothetical protein
LFRDARTPTLGLVVEGPGTYLELKKVYEKNVLYFKKGMTALSSLSEPLPSSHTRASVLVRVKSQSMNDLDPDRKPKW